MISIFDPIEYSDFTSEIHKIGGKEIVFQYNHCEERDVLMAPVSYDPIEEIKNHLFSFLGLQENWDGYGASTLSRKAAINVLLFLNILPMESIQGLTKDGITLSTYGTVEVEFNSKGRLYSFEIGTDRIESFFLEEGSDKIVVGPTINMSLRNELSRVSEFLNFQLI